MSHQTTLTETENQDFCCYRCGAEIPPHLAGCWNCGATIDKRLRTLKEKEPQK